MLEYFDTHILLSNVCSGHRSKEEVTVVEVQKI